MSTPFAAAPPPRNSNNKSEPGLINLVVHRDDRGAFAARDTDCDWVVNRAAVGFVGAAVVSYTSVTAWVAKSQSPDFRAKLFRDSPGLHLVRCSGLKSYIISGADVDSLLREIQAGYARESSDLVTKLRMIAGAAEAVAEQVGWGPQAFLLKGGPEPEPDRVVVYL